MRFDKQWFGCLFACVTLLTAHARAEEYRLVIARQTVNVTGHSVEKITVNGTIPGPILQFTEGEIAVIHVSNQMNEITSVHWHGILLPDGMDGAPGLGGFAGIAPGETFTYRFTVRQSGTYWYHAHTMGQEQDGLYGALIFKPEKETIRADRDYVVVLSDFTDEDSYEVLANLKITSDYYNHARRTVGDFFQDVQTKGFWRAWRKALDWGEMRMSPTDLTDVSGYTFLVNGMTPEQNWTGLFKPGEHIRLRFINASAMSIYDLRIIDEKNQSLKMTVVQADGQNIEPVTVNEFRFGVAETYDVIIESKEDRVYTLVAEPIDRSGFALATLSPYEGKSQEGLKREMPEQRLRSLLTMADMGASQDMGAMDHSKMTAEDMEGMLDNVRSGWANAGTPRGDKALSYKDLRFAGVQKDVREPARDIVVRLGGNMERYIWTLNGLTYENAEPILLQYGERVRLKFINETMMAHPMHLHGMFVQLENGQPAGKLPNKHTVIVAPGQSYSVLLTADEPGEWAFHCHLLYHMASGMMSKFVVARLDAPPPPVLQKQIHKEVNQHVH